jgi:hypothetical protein
MAEQASDLSRKPGARSHRGSSAAEIRKRRCAERHSVHGRDPLEFYAHAVEFELHVGKPILGPVEIDEKRFQRTSLA